MKNKLVLLATILSLAGNQVNAKKRKTTNLSKYDG
jgi:hypothetical protein